MRTCQALSNKLKQDSRAGKLREVWGSTVPGRNKRAVSAKGKEEIRCPEVAGGSPGPVVAQQDGPRRARARDRHLHPQRLLLLCNNAQRATGVTTQQPGEKSSCASGRLSPLGIVLPSDGVLRCWVFGICRVAPLCGVCPTSEPARISMG